MDAEKFNITWTFIKVAPSTLPYFEPLPKMRDHDPQMTGEKPQQLDPTIDFVAGTVAGMYRIALNGLALILSARFNVKVRFQDPATASRYSSTAHALTTIVKEERVSGLYKGITAPMFGSAILNGIVFGTYGFLMRLQLQSHQKEPSLTQVFIAGAGSGVVSSLVTCPTEQIKIRQQSTLDNSKLPSVWKITRDIYKQKGIRGLYRGYTPTAARELGYGAYFLTYEAVCRSFRKRIEPPTSPLKSGSLAREADVELAKVPWYGVLLAGGLAGPASWIATFPFDVIKTRMQTTPQIPTSSAQGITAMPREMTALETALDCYRRDGPKTFVAGLAPTLIRAVPVNIIAFGAFEFVVQLLTSPKHHS